MKLFSFIVKLFAGVLLTWIILRLLVDSARSAEGTGVRPDSQSRLVDVGENVLHVLSVIGVVSAVALLVVGFVTLAALLALRGLH
jgi:hypothetical protein